MGKAAGASIAATSALMRKRPNAPGQQSITAAFQAAKRLNTTNTGAGKLNNHTLDAAADVMIGSDQLDDTDTAACHQHGAAAATQHCDKPQSAASAEKQEQTYMPQRSTAAKPNTGRGKAAVARKPRAQSAKPAATAAAQSDTSGSEVEVLDIGGGGAAAGDEADAAAAVEPRFTEDETAAISGSLLAWYDRVQRVLPWRRNPFHTPAKSTAAAAADKLTSAAGEGNSSGSKHKKPNAKQLAAAAAEAALAAAKPAPAELSPQEFAYYVWVSEIMLQQTQVSRVITYFNKWVATWPTVTALAAATQEEVNEVWAGLGYYRRAKYLLDGAKFIVNELGGKFPETAVQLRQIPGVGPYTAAAVASIAFNDQAAAVDGNVIRVCARLRAVKGDPTKLVKVWDKLALQLLHPDRPGCHNQAMMELGATVCKPVNPSCTACPVSSYCAAFKLAAAAGDVEDAPKVTDYPEKVTKAAKAEQQVAVCILKVLVLPGASTPAAVAAAAAAAGVAGAKSSQQAAAAVGTGRKTSIRSFFKPSTKQQQQHEDNKDDDAAAAAIDEAGKPAQQQLQLCESDLLAAGATAHYLLVQRPENGLLAGLWEFPGVIIDCEPTPTARRSAVDSYMSQALGVAFPTSSSSSSGSNRAKSAAPANPTAAAAAAGVHVVHRRQLGSVVHIFSHIRQTLLAEELVLLAPSVDAVCGAAAGAAAAACAGAQQAAAMAVQAKPSSADITAEDTSNEEPVGKAQLQRRGKKRTRQNGAAAAAEASAERPAMRWVAASDMAQTGLTSGVRKVFNLSLK